MRIRNLCVVTCAATMLFSMTSPVFAAETILQTTAGSATTQKGLLKGEDYFYSAVEDEAPSLVRQRATAAAGSGK